MAIKKEDITREQRVGRRGFLVTAGLSVVGTVAAVAAGKPAGARASGGTPDGGTQQKYSCTDSDVGAGSDPIGGGDTCNDADTGCGADPVR